MIAKCIKPKKTKIAAICRLFNLKDKFSKLSPTSRLTDYSPQYHPYAGAGPWPAKFMV